MEETRNRAPSWVWIVLVIAVLVSLACGLFFGGLGGYLLAKSSQTRYEYRYGPDMPIMPEMPRMPTPFGPRPRTPDMPGQGPEFGYGALITYVAPDSPAAAAEIQVRDIIYRVNGRNLTADYGLADAIRANEPGDRVTLTLWRTDRETGEMGPINVTVRLGEHPDQAGLAYLGVDYAVTRGGMMD